MEQTVKQGITAFLDKKDIKTVTYTKQDAHRLRTEDLITDVTSRNVCSLSR